MNKNIYLCEEGNCGKVDLSELYMDNSFASYGLCCYSCDKKCKNECILLNHKHLKVVGCSCRKDYKTTLKDTLKNKRKDMITNMKQILEIEKRLSNLEGRVNISSPLDCKICGGEVVYNTEDLLLTYPPKYKGVCTECESVKLITKSIYEENIKK